MKYATAVLLALTLVACCGPAYGALRQHSRGGRALRADDENDAIEFASASSPCDHCKSFISATASRGVQNKMDARDMIMFAQNLGQSMGVCNSLKLECPVYSEVKTFLRQGGLLDHNGLVSPKLADTSKNPFEACRRLKKCGSPNWSPPAASVPKAKQAVVVRLRIKKKIAALPRNSTQWQTFVHGFLNDVATVLHANPSRLSLHQGQKDFYTEVIIRPSMKSGSHAPTPRALGRLLRAVLRPGSNALNVPPKLLQSVNRKFKAEIIPISIPTSVAEKPLKATNSSYKPKDCATLKQESLKACGSNFACTPQCKSAFALYHGRCLGKVLDPVMYQRNYDTFVKFFRVCERCTSTRLALVKARCKLSTPKSNLPSRCSLYCSQAFVPYYKECLADMAQGWTEQQRIAVSSFHKTCSRCNVERERAVHKICDDRPGNPASYYPATCTQKCAAMYGPFYDACLYGETNGVPLGSRAFRDVCRVAAAGGSFFRITLNMDITTVVHQETFRQEVAQEIASAVHVPVSRLRSTGIFAIPSEEHVVQLGTNLTEVRRTTGKIKVDFQLLVSTDVLKPDPMTVVDRLRHIVMQPKHRFFMGKLGRHVSSTDGIIMLAPNSHVPAAHKGPSSLELAKLELRKGKERGASANVLRLLAAIVQYHTSVEKNARASTIKADLANVAYRMAIAHNVNTEELAYAKQRLTFLRMADRNASATALAENKAFVEYLGAIARGDHKTVVDKQWGILQWRKAISNKADSKAIQLLHAIMVRLSDIAAGRPTEVLNYDQAVINAAQNVAHNATLQQIKFDKAVIDYMGTLKVHANKDVVNAAEALVEYREAILKRRRAIVIKERRAIVDYMKAIEHKKRKEVLHRLAHLVIALHRQAKLEAQQAAAAGKNTTKTL